MEKVCSKKGGSNPTAFFLFFCLEGVWTLQTPHALPSLGPMCNKAAVAAAWWGLTGVAFVNIFVSKYHPNSKVKYFPTWLIVIWESFSWSSAEPSVHFLLLIFPWGKPICVTICTGNDLPNRLWMFSGFYLPKVSYAKRGPTQTVCFVDLLFFQDACWVAVTF